MVTIRTIRSKKSSTGNKDAGSMNTLLAGLLLAVLVFLAFPVYLAEARDGRWIDVNGVSNFRDMGGYPAGGGTVKNGVLFRSGDLSKISADGMGDLRRLGIVTVVDLRIESGDSSRIEELSGGAVTVKRLAMRADPIKDRNDYYKRMIVNSRESLIGLLALLADGKNLPMVIFDEDGINEVDVAAQFILLGLGVSGPDAVSDYLFSNERGASLKREWGEIIVRYFDEYGGMDYYTTKILGISSDQIGRIRKNLITQ
jgi:protein-tyrosine phosphatase